MNSNNGNVKNQTIVDIVFGSSALFSNFASLFKISPIDVGLNMISAFYTAISNTMSAASYEEEIHISQLDEILLSAAKLVLVN